MFENAKVMDIDLLTKLVKDVILEKDEVALPGIGTFIVDDVPSTFSDKGFTINPPYRYLSFRQKESADDSLVKLYAKTTGLTQEDAGTILKTFLSEMKEVLKQKKVIVFPELGRLRATKENNFFFVSEEGLNISPSSFGLEPVSLKNTVAEARFDLKVEDTVVKEKVETPAEPKEEKEVIAPKAVKEKSSSWRSVVWIIAIVLVAFAALAVLGRVAPQVVDPLLYDAEELKLLGY